MNEPNYTDQFMNEAVYQANQSGQGQDPNSLYADYMKEEKARNIIEQINPDYLLEDIEHRIRGELKDRMSKEWREGSKQFNVSELLVTNYISFLGSILNQNTSLSNFNVKEINNLMEMVIDYTRDDLSDNAEEYGFVKIRKLKTTKILTQLKEYTDKEGLILTKEIPIKVETDIELDRVTDFNEMTRIGNIILMSTFAVLKRAQNGMEAQRIFRQLNMNESNNPIGQKKGGIAEMLKFWS